MAQSPEIVTVQFKTAPATARVLLRTDPDRQPELLGTADRPIKLDLAQLARFDSATLVFQAPGYLDTWNVVQNPYRLQGGARAQGEEQWKSLRAGVWPPARQGYQVELKPDDEKTVVFWTYPPQAAVYVTSVSAPHGQGKPVGFAGQPIRLKSSGFWDPAKQTLRDPEVQFRGVKYYDDSTPIVASGVLDNGRFPEKGLFQLTTPYWWAPLYYYARLHPTQLAFGIPLVVGGMIGGVVVFFRRRRQMEFMLAREKRLAQLENDARYKEDQWLGKLLGRWRLMSKLGAGGMAVVYRAIDDADLLLGEEAPGVALKLMNVELSDNEEFRKRFEREINVCKKLNDPAIVRLEDFGDQDGHLYLVMELVDGQPLRDFVRANFPLGEALEYFEQILTGLAHAHREGVVHRDIKPDNIMVSKEGRIKIMDFGLARSQAVNTQITQSGAVLGTPAYVSPEQITGGGMNKSSDQYSLGITFYELLTGRRPFTNEDSVALLFSHLSEQATSMREWRPEIPESIDKVVLRMLLKDPSERFADLEECLKALKAARKDTSETPPSPDAMPQPRSKSYNTNIAT